ncbi:peptide ABC transporter substrate-binding protein [Sporanaerobacter sp. PP17-6a]|uniref:peptide ABC transporter substrate-binding protein n=1 Tax=Sporanaerobacter sp. PP17-6a TaxID=1891289 RepID=UPI00089FBE11|nr:peptide ABC transporter substrate-binding protein [Sporanaerobacter sp. PP17-6a]SCL94836.1 Oligopeptide-binding protein AppA precursor [Sporanaerobacter sp. PP17-6a]
MKFRRITAVFLLVVLTILSVGCKNKNEVGGTIDNNKEKIESGEEEKPEYGGTLRVPLTTVETLNPLISENISYYNFSKLIFEGLFKLDKNLNIENQLVQNYEIKEDGKVIGIKLRENVVWHDGEKFTAKDVKFTIDTLKYAGNDNIYKNSILSNFKSYTSSDLRHIMDVKIIDDYNIEIVFDRAFSNGLEILTFPIIPRHIFVKGRENSSSYKAALAEDNYTPIGTGPYKFSKYEKIKSINLEANTNWWQGKPYISTIIGEIMKDEDLAMTSFEANQVDLTTSVGVDWEKYFQSKRVKIIEYVSQNYELLGFNFSRKVFADEKGKELRKAIAYGIDRQSIIQKVYMGHATQVDLPIYPNSWLISDNSNIYGFNIDKAKEILSSAGYKDENGDGFVEDENGKTLTLKVTTNSYNPLRLKTADLIVENLKAIGINATKDYEDNVPNNITDEEVEEQWQKYTQKIKKGDFDIALMGWQLSDVCDLSFAFHSSQIYYGTNFIRYSDEEMDQLLFDAFSATNREEKKKAYGKLEDKILEDLPYVSLFFRNEALLIDKNIKGNINPQSNNLYYNIEKWYIPKEFQEKNVD